MRPRGKPYSLPHTEHERAAAATARTMWKHLVRRLRTEVQRDLVRQHLECRGSRPIEKVISGSITAYWIGSFLLGANPSEVSTGRISIPTGADGSPPTATETAALWHAAVARRLDEHGDWAALRARGVPHAHLQPAMRRDRNLRPRLVRLCRVGPILWGSVPAAWAALEHERRAATCR